MSDNLKETIERYADNEIKSLLRRYLEDKLNHDLKPTVHQEEIQKSLKSIEFAIHIAGFGIMLILVFIGYKIDNILTKM